VPAGQAPEIDLVLGGHDHDRYMRTENRTLLLKSGTDFRDLSVITVAAEQPAVDAATPWAERPPVALSVEAITITRDCPPDDAAARLVKVHLSHVEKRMGKVRESRPRGEDMGAADRTDLTVFVLAVIACTTQVLCSLTMPLDARFSQIRTCETNVANWVRREHLPLVAPTVVLTRAPGAAPAWRFGGRRWPTR